jgi:hypothetical protein
MHMNQNILIGSVVTGVALVLAFAARAADLAPHEKLAVWEGRWKLKERILETPFSHAGSVTLDGNCAFHPNGSYMICDFLTEGPDPESGAVSNNLSLFYYSAADKAFKHTGMGTEGGPHEQVAAVDGNVWTTQVEITGRSGKKLQLRNTYVFESPMEYRMRFEVSQDGGARWTPLHDDVATKVG